jgi:hypothetical protein
MRTAIVLLCVLGVVLASQTALMGQAPGAGALPQLTGADFKPGRLKLSLIVTERGGVDRKATVVSSGVPFPPGFLPDIVELAVVDENGRPVASQATVMVNWHKPAYDDSAQWVLVSFVADVPANGTSTYYLTDSGKAAGAPATRMKVENSADQIVIATGAASFTIPLAGEALLSSAKVGGNEVLAKTGLRATIATGDWPEREIKAGDKETATHGAAGVTIEESGPTRVVVAIKGRYKPGDKDGKFYLFTTRLYFTAGSASVRVIHTISNGELDPTRGAGGLRHIYIWPIKDASLAADLAVGDNVTVSTPIEGNETATSQMGLLVHQDSSGGDKWNASAKSQDIAFRGYKVTESGKEIAAGNGHLGVLSVAGGGVGLSAALRNFRLEWPHAIEGSAKSLRVGLFPGESGGSFHLNVGQRKSWDLRLTFFAGSAPGASKEFGIQDALLLFRPQPAWMVRTAAAGCWPYGMGLLPDKHNGKPPLRRDVSNVDKLYSGWYLHGLIPTGWNGGGHHWNEETMYIPWVLWGDGRNLDEIEASSIWCGDLVAYQWENVNLKTFWAGLGQHGRMDENDLSITHYPGWKDLDTWGLPDSGHGGMVIFPEYYLLTGDMRAREAVEHLGVRSRAWMWVYNHNDVNDGTGPHRTAIAASYCSKKDADADPQFRLFNRYIGWPLFNMANSYRLTGDPEMLADCRNLARSFRNTARQSPIGFMCMQINKIGDREIYGGQGPFEKYRDKSASSCYAHFQMALMCHGLWEYYLVSRDQEALDPMIGFADLMTHHAMLKNPQGKSVGWTYAFGDYWGPYTWEDRGTDKLVGWSDWHYNVVEVMGWVAQLTGRPDYAKVCEDATNGYSKGFDVAAAVMAQQRPYHDFAPLAIGDLKAEALGGGKVRLTWTAPAGKGDLKASRYQVKYSTAKIVELTRGWPDRSEPLPQTAQEWEAKADAFNARQRAFWAANNAANPPNPGAAGSAESMTVSGLAPGRCNFAVKAWVDGESPTLGPLSNVVEITVK